MMVEITWKDNQFSEIGEIMEQTESDILFHSSYDGTINWIPVKHIDIKNQE